VYLLDTNICIYIINNRNENVVEKIKSIDYGEVYLSSISLAELEYGACKSKESAKTKLALHTFVSPFNIINFDDYDAEVFGLIRSDLEKKGEIIGPYDMQIAAQAISRNLTLVTNNTKEFMRVEKLRLENWVS